MEAEYTSPLQHITAAETGARAELSAPSLITRLIITATCAADRLGVGFSDLLPQRLAWVLSRISVEMERMPRIHDEITISTWVESLRHGLSERNFRIDAADGTPMGYARSVWACIDIDTRRPAPLQFAADVFRSHPCPIDRFPRLRPVADPTDVITHRIAYSDIDFNRHVNSARYIELADNCLPMDFHLGNRLRRIDVAYLHETLFDAEAEVRLASPAPLSHDFDIAVGGTSHCLVRTLHTPDPAEKL